MSRITQSNGRIFVRPERNVISSTAEVFRQELLQIVTDNNLELVIDLANVKTIDSVGLGVFIATFNTLKKKDKKLQVINASPKIHSLFKTMGLTRRFRVQGKDPGSGRKA